jgi:hypothetical protein
MRTPVAVGFTREVAEISPEMIEAMLLRSQQGKQKVSMQSFLADKDLPAAVFSLHQATGNLLGSDGHRRPLRKEGVAYTLRWGPPLQAGVHNAQHCRQQADATAFLAERLARHSHRLQQRSHTGGHDQLPSQNRGATGYVRSCLHGPEVPSDSEKVLIQDSSAEARALKDKMAEAALRKEVELGVDRNLFEKQASWLMTTSYVYKDSATYRADVVAQWDSSPAVPACYEHAHVLLKRTLMSRI